MRRIRDSGVTLVELSFALAVAAVLAGLAIPAFRSTLRASAVRSAVYDLMAGLQQTRGSSILEAHSGVLCLADSSGICRSSPATAWSAFLEVEGRPQPLAQASLPVGLELRSSRSRLTFWPSALAATTATLTICDTRGIAKPRAIVVSQSGRARLAAARDAECL